MKLLFLGTGTSHGVPVIGCNCDVCKSSDPHDKRFRCSAYVTTASDKNILIDIGPDFRSQALAYNISRVDTLLLTHSHADHLHGIDDLRIFSCDLSESDLKNKKLKPESKRKYDAPPIPIYTNKNTIKDIEKRFDYFFRHCREGGGHAKVELINAKSQFETCGITVTPIPMLHGHLETVGWLLTENRKSIAYLTDCSFISDESIQIIKENCGILEHLVIDGLRIEDHSTHFSFMQALEAAEKIGAKHVWLTHITHSTSHRKVILYIDDVLETFPEKFKNLNNIAESVQPAYDGLVLEA
ncbi:MAG: MBL fold metallo-hydrolase [Treponema sp.]|nr:MBL fold metallo-hydrolase [Treponema sp.]